MKTRGLAFRRAFWFGVLLQATPALARKTNDPLYQDPFDIGAGGASLTRASKEGVLFSNPALLPLSPGFMRWVGLTTTLLANKESISTAESLAKTAQKNSASGSSKTSTAAETQQVVDDIFQTPVRVGWGEALSFLTKKFGLAVFSRFELDLQAKAFGSTGLPQVQLQTESYHGAVAGFSIPTQFRWLLFGLTAKYIYAGEDDLSADVSDSQTISQFTNPKMVQNLDSLNTGAGADAGMLIFLQGSTVDFTMAGKVDDIGGTHLSGPAEAPTQFKQVEDVGLGLTLHDTIDMIHFAIDYRDVTNVYQEDLFKHIYAGTKITLRQHFGIATGLYNGYPSMGAEVDLFFCRFAFTSYTRELGDHPGVEPRHIYMGSVSIGF